MEALFRKDDAEFVYVKKAETPKRGVTAGFLASVFAGRQEGRPAAEARREGQVEGEVRGRARSRPGLASFDKVEIVKGLEPGTEVAVEDPTQPKEKKDRE